MEIEWEIEGIEELDARLAALSDRMKKKILRKALKEAAQPIKQDIARGARRASGGPTYAARFNPQSKKGGGARGPGHMAENIESQLRITRDGEARIKVGPNKSHWYMSFQEWGTPTAPAKPVLRPALDRNKEKSLWIFTDIVNEELEAEWR